MTKGARIKTARHERLSWRIREIAPDFTLIDAWRLPVVGRREEFAEFVDVFKGLDLGSGSGSGLSGALFTIRTWLGERLRWDEQTNDLPIPGCDEASLIDRMPGDLPPADDESDSPFRPVYQTSEEWAAEISNSTVHAILHLGWVPRKGGTYRGQMGIYVKHRGWLGRVYMPLIAPFRHYIVYPALMRRIGSAWQARAESVSLAPEGSTP